MKGETAVEVPQQDGTAFTVRFDRPKAQPLWIKFEATTITGGPVATEQDLRAALLDALKYSICQNADITAVAKAAREAMPDVVIFNAGVSADGTTHTPIATPAAKRNRFVLEAGHIIINGHDN
jgi:hypothetical protein